MSEPLRWEEVLPLREEVGVELGEAGVLGWKLLCRLSPAVSALDSDPLRVAVMVVDMVKQFKSGSTTQIPQRSWESDEVESELGARTGLVM